MERAALLPGLSGLSVQRKRTVAERRKHESTGDAPVLQLHSVSPLWVVCLAAGRQHYVNQAEWRVSVGCWWWGISGRMIGQCVGNGMILAAHVTPRANGFGSCRWRVLYRVGIYQIPNSFVSELRRDNNVFTNDCDSHSEEKPLFMPYVFHCAQSELLKTRWGIRLIYGLEASLLL